MADGVEEASKIRPVQHEQEVVDPPFAPLRRE